MSTRAERVERVTELHARGLNGLQIAAALGISRAYAYELLTDPAGVGARARKDRYAGTCVDCGAPTGGGDGRRETPRCVDCAARIISAKARGRYADKRAVYPAAVEAWNAGAHCTEVAEILGVTLTGLGAKLAKLRKQGYDVQSRGQTGRVYKADRKPGPPKTHCVHGHPLSGDNLAIWAGERICRTCRRATERRARLKRKATREATR